MRYALLAQMTSADKRNPREYQIMKPTEKDIQPYFTSSL